MALIYYNNAHITEVFYKIDVHNENINKPA